MVGNRTPLPAIFVLCQRRVSLFFSTGLLYLSSGKIAGFALAADEPEWQLCRYLGIRYVKKCCWVVFFEVVSFQI